SSKKSSQDSCTFVAKYGVRDSSGKDRTSTPRPPASSMSATMRSTVCALLGELGPNWAAATVKGRAIQSLLRREASSSHYSAISKNKKMPESLRHCATAGLLVSKRVTRSCRRLRADGRPAILRRDVYGVRHLYPALRQNGRCPGDHRQCAPRR